jgi:hypothetical protein
MDLDDTPPKVNGSTVHLTQNKLKEERKEKKRKKKIKGIMSILPFWTIK